MTKARFALLLIPLVSVEAMAAPSAKVVIRTIDHLTNEPVPGVQLGAETHRMGPDDEPLPFRGEYFRLFTTDEGGNYVFTLPLHAEHETTAVVSLRDSEWYNPTTDPAYTVSGKTGEPPPAELIVQVAPAAKVAGVIFDRAGVPVEIVARSGEEVVARVRPLMVGRRGYYRLEGLPPGHYTIGRESRYAKTLPHLDVREVTVGMGEEVIGVNLELLPPHPVTFPTGAIVPQAPGAESARTVIFRAVGAGSGEPVPDVSLRWSGTTWFPLAGETEKGARGLAHAVPGRSDHEGAFRLAIPMYPNGSSAFRIAVEDAEWVRATVPETSDIETGPGEPLPGEVAIPVVKGAGILGRVYHERTGGAVLGVLIYRDASPSPHGAYERTDTLGRYRLGGLRLGSHTLRIDPWPDYAVTGDSVAREVRLETEGEAVQDWPVLPARRVSGKVLDVEGNPMAGALVYGSHPDHAVLSDRDGAFSLPGFCPGRPARLEAYKPGTDGGAVLDISVGEDDVEEVVLRMQPPAPETTETEDS